VSLVRGNEGPAEGLAAEPPLTRAGLRAWPRGTWIVALVAGALGCGAPRETGTTAGGLHYEIGGRGEPVVLLHGFSLDSRMWDSQFDLLERDFRTVRYDLRGHGESADAGAAFYHHEDLRELLDELDVGRAALVGLSLGAEVAIDFALQYPERVASLVLASPGLGGYRPQGGFEWMGDVMSALQTGDAREATRAWVETPLMRIEDPAADSVMELIVMSNWEVWTGDPSLIRRIDPPAIGRLAELSVPTLVIIGGTDLIDTGLVADTLMACVPGAERMTVPGVGHLVNLAAPDAFNEVVRRFLTTTPAAGSTTPAAGSGCAS